MTYSDREHTLVLGDAEGRLPETVRLTVRLFLPEGGESACAAEYDGHGITVSLQ